jgi:hypothetical protein
MLGLWQIFLIVFAFIIPIITLIDVLRNEFTKNNKLIWVLVIIFFNIFGTLLYLIFGTRQKFKKNRLKN